MSCCDTQINARRNADFRFTYGPSSRKFTFSGMYPRFSVRRGEIELLAVTDAATVNGSSFVVVGDDIVLTVTKEDLALLDSATPDTQSEDLFYDITLTDGSGFENWLLGNAFILLGLNDDSSCNCNGTAEVSLGGQCIEISIEGGNIAAGASVSLSELNEAVNKAEQAADDAEASANQAATAGSEAGAISGAAAGSASGTIAGDAAGTAAANLVVGNKVDLDAGNITAWDTFKAGARISVRTLAELQAIPAGGVSSVWVDGRTQNNDGYAGHFEWVTGDQSANVAADPTQAIWTVPSGQTGLSGAWKRVFVGAAKIEWWGGKGDAQTDNSAALLAMASTVGYVSLSAGRYRIQGDITLDVPIEFGEGSFDIDSGVIVTLRHRIDAPTNRQIIFGAGNIIFGNVSGLTGEAAKEAHSVWWGVKTGQSHGDQAPIINKAMDSFGNTREGVLYFANGTHRMESTAYVPRCVTIKGLRPRTTLFYPISDGWPVFETMEDGCGFEGIQFENNRTVMPLRASPLIHIKHTNAYVEDCMLTTCGIGILCEAEGLRVHRLGWNHDAQDGAEGTAVIKLTRGRAQIRGLYGYLGKTYGVASLVLIEPSAFAPGISIRDVDSACWSRAVRVNVSGGFSVNGLSISGLSLSPQGGQNGPNAIEINVGTGTYVSNVNIVDANINARFNDGITMNVEDGGTLTDVNIDNVNMAGSTAASARTGIKVTMGAGSTGSINRVKIGANRNIVRPSGQDIVVPTGDSRVTVTVL